MWNNIFNLSVFKVPCKNVLQNTNSKNFIIQSYARLACFQVNGNGVLMSIWLCKELLVSVIIPHIHNGFKETINLHVARRGNFVLKRSNFGRYPLDILIISSAELEKSILHRTRTVDLILHLLQQSCYEGISSVSINRRNYYTHQQSLHGMWVLYRDW